MMVNKNNSLMMLQRNSMSIKQLDMVEDKLMRRKSMSMWRQGVIRNYTDTMMMMMMRERKISSSLKKNEKIMLQTQPAAMATAMEASVCTRRRRRRSSRRRETEEVWFCVCMYTKNGRDFVHRIFVHRIRVQIDVYVCISVFWACRLANLPELSGVFTVYIRMHTFVFQYLVSQSIMAPHCCARSRKDP